MSRDPFFPITPKRYQPFQPETVEEVFFLLGFAEKIYHNRLTFWQIYDRNVLLAMMAAIRRL